MENTVVGVYDSYSQAQNAMNELIASGFSRSDVQLNPDQEPSVRASTATDASDTSHHSGIGHFFRSLFGMDDNDAQQTHGTYAEAVRRGSCVLTVNADSDDQRERAVDIMNRYDPVDIDERTEHWKSSGWTGYDASAPWMSDDEITQERTRYSQSRSDTSSAMNLQGTTRTEGTSKIPVIEEDLKVGKREVQRGGVRVFQRVRETPVHESVQLREEHVKVERHPVNKPATQADLAAFKEGSIELRETAEEAVVSKEARVVEEVEIGKEVSQRTQEINDTVRRTDVEVEQLGASGSMRSTGTGITGDDDAYRSHWQTAYGSGGGRYEDYDSAYRYGSSLSGNERFKNYRWDDVEPNARTEWESKNPGSSWDKVKDAVRYGAERVTGNNRRS